MDFIEITRQGLEGENLSGLPINNLQSSQKVSGAESGALGAQMDKIDPDLQFIIDAWPGLSEEVKEQILNLARVAAESAED